MTIALALAAPGRRIALNAIHLDTSVGSNKPSGMPQRTLGRWRVRVGVILPGAIDTNFNDRSEGSRPGPEALRPADVAAAVVTMLHRSPTAQIDELTLHPMDQNA